VRVSNRFEFVVEAPMERAWACENGDAAFSWVRCHGVVALFFYRFVKEQGLPRVWRAVGDGAACVAAVCCRDVGGRGDGCWRARLNSEGIEVSLDSLGESVMQVSQAEESAAIYHRLLDEIAARKLKANVSVKLTQMGMDIGGHGCRAGAGGAHCGRGGGACGGMGALCASIWRARSIPRRRLR
jgi:hypothetical protein